MPTPPVAIVVPCYNDANTIHACIRSVLEHTTYADWKLIVVDDGSTDGTIPPGIDARVQTIRQPRRGCAAAVNAGIAAMTGRDIVRLHADVVIDTPGWLERLVEAAYADTITGVVGVRLLYPDNRIYSEGRDIVTGLGMHPQHCARGAFLPDGPAGKVTEVDSVSGALAYYRREAIDRVGGFDDAYGPAWLDDDDFCIGARRLGYKIRVQPAVKAVHYTRSKSPTHRTYVGGTENEINQLTSRIRTVCNEAQMEYWEAKWGWHPGHPDIGEIRRLYASTEICWRIGESLRYRPSSEQPSVDCCLATRNNLALLKRCLESLALVDYPADRLHVYITSNASTDGTTEYLDELAHSYPFPLHHFKPAVATGCALGLNFAFSAGQSEIVARLDDDIVLPTDWLKILVADLRARPFAGCAGGKIVNDNDHHTIQCGPCRQYPNHYEHVDELDRGQADYLARVTHVRGCFNVYRRDVLQRCGLLDLRYSPVQFDDPDHHIALLQAGYEIVYDGRVRVVHKLNTGVSQSHEGISSARANCAKLHGKWGTDVWTVLERSIELSREGRYLPDNGDTRAWLARGPAPESFPRKIRGSFARANAGLAPAYEELVKADRREDVGRWVDEYLALAAIQQRQGALRTGLEMAQNAVNLAPGRVDALALLGEIYHELGKSDLSATIARFGLAFQPADPRLLALQAAAPRTAGMPRSNGPDLISGPGTSISRPTNARSGLRILMVMTFEGHPADSDMHQLEQTRRHIELLGHEIEVCCTPRPDPRGYDLVHVWTSAFPSQTLAQVKAIRARCPEVPIVHTPIFWDIREKCWADAAIPALFTQANSAAQLEESLKQLAADKLRFNGRSRSQAGEPNYPGHDAYQRAIFPLVDHLLPQSLAEIVNLRKVHGIGRPYTVVRPGTEIATLDAATPDWFVENFHVQDFVLSVAPVEQRRNQLLLLHALRDAGLPVVLIGPPADRNYHRLCRRLASQRTIFIDRLPPEKLASAYKAARVHALPSWMEGAALTGVEAALAGCSIVASDRTSEREYFGETANYCDPASTASIRSAVVSAWQNHAANAAPRMQLAQELRAAHAWEAVAGTTLAAYKAAIEHSRERAAA